MTTSMLPLLLALLTAVAVAGALLGIRMIFSDERPIENARSFGGCQGQQRVCQSMAIELRSSIRDEGGRP